MNASASVFPQGCDGSAIIRLALLACLLFAATAKAAEPLCRGVIFDNARFTVCTVDLREHEVRLVWQDETGSPYASFRNLPRDIDGRQVRLAMNAGMYNAELAPIGLYVEDGEEFQHLSTTDGPGNFHLKPNGVFHVSDGRAGISATEAYRDLELNPDFATQSGPMLVIDDRIHPRFLRDSSSRKRRNGVGVRDPHTVVFAITEHAVNFHTFARLFRDELGCSNALFLDGSMSSLYVPAQGRADALRPMGPMLVVLDHQ